MIEFEITFDGASADDGLLEFYDASRALMGFQRSLALATHLAINGEIITQAPSASGFQILIPPIAEGSWKGKAIIVFSAAVAVGSAGKDSPIGQIVTSIYDAALYTTMGFNVDYDKTLQQQYAEYLQRREITPEAIDSLCEKIESSVADMHRPITHSETATRAQIATCGAGKRDIGPLMNPMTYEYVRQTIRDDDETTITGYISSYNINTFKGRIYCVQEKRLISFELAEGFRSRRNVAFLTRSQHINGQDRFSEKALVTLTGNKLLSPSGKIKRMVATSVAESP